MEANGYARNPWSVGEDQSAKPLLQGTKGERSGILVQKGAGPDIVGRTQHEEVERDN